MAQYFILKIIYYFFGGYIFWLFIANLYKNNFNTHIENDNNKYSFMNIGLTISTSHIYTCFTLLSFFYIFDTVCLSISIYKICKSIINTIVKKIFLSENINIYRIDTQNNNLNNNLDNDQHINLNNEQNDNQNINLNINLNDNHDFNDLFSHFTFLPGEIKTYKNGDMYDGYLFAFKKHGMGYYYNKQNNTTYLQNWNYGMLLYSDVYYQGDNLIKIINDLSICNEKELENELNDIKCVISHDIMKNPISLQCGHSYDKRCIVLSMLKDIHECPLCKQEILNYEPNLYLMDILKKCKFVYLNDKNESKNIDLETINKYYDNFYKVMS